MAKIRGTHNFAKSITRSIRRETTRKQLEKELPLFINKLNVLISTSRQTIQNSVNDYQDLVPIIDGNKNPERLSKTERREFPQLKKSTRKTEKGLAEAAALLILEKKAQSNEKRYHAGHIAWVHEFVQWYITEKNRTTLLTNIAKQTHPPKKLKPPTQSAATKPHNPNFLDHKTPPQGNFSTTSIAA
ncbi:MAG: hypothetical protein Q9N68_14165 [Gammaproteobacteria bacterium]|nr:hypothetical protein [Gammaproteobacteria bacterium]